MSLSMLRYRWGLSVKRNKSRRGVSEREVEMKSIGISAALYLWNAMRRVEAAGGLERSDCDSDLLMLMRILEVKEVMHCCGEVR